MNGEQQWWYCLKHNTVESEPTCPGKDRLGPYPTKEAAEHALDTVEGTERGLGRAGPRLSRTGLPAADRDRPARWTSAAAQCPVWWAAAAHQAERGVR